MKILVPTDFSPVADDALHAACLFGQKQNAVIHLFHVASLPQEWIKLPLSNLLLDKLKNAIAESSQKQLEERAKKVRDMGLSVKVHYVVGDYLQQIQAITKKNKFELVVVGSHGTGGKNEWILGSNTQKVIRYLHTNALVIKNKLTDIAFKKVLFTSGLLEEDQVAFKRFLDFIEIFPVEEVHVLAVETKGFFSPPKIVMLEALKDFKAIAGKYDCHTHFHSHLSVEAGVRQFVKDRGVEIVAISNHKRHPLKRIFSGSNVELLVNHLNVPVLSIDY